jgi:hypothetical protein
MKRGNELCSFINKVRSHKKLHDKPTRAHEFEARTNISKQGPCLSGFLHPNHGRRKGASLSNVPPSSEINNVLSW